MPPLSHGIRSVKIENYRCIDQLELDFTDPQGRPSDIVVIGGPNGCGKTAVLEACVLALGGEANIHGAKGQKSIRNGTRKATISIAYFNESDGKVQEQDVRYCIDTGTVSATIDGVPISPANAIPHLYISSSRTPKLVGPLPISNDHGFENGLPFIKQRLINLKAFELMGGHRHPSLDFEYELSALSNVWRQFYPASKAQFTIEPASVVASAGFDVYLTDNQGKISVDQLSSGQIELFAFFATLLPTRKLSLVIFIDEPELHLDPQWHALLLREMRRFLPNAQFIVATHSPQIASSVRSDQRFFLVAEDDPRVMAWGLKVKSDVLETAHV